MKRPLVYSTMTRALSLQFLLSRAVAATAKEPVDWVDTTIITASPHGLRWILFASA